MMHFYRLFGLTFAASSEIVGMQAAATPPVAAPDVMIRFDAVAPIREGRDFLDMKAAGEDASFTFEVYDVVRICVSGGAEIVVDASLSSPARARDYLLGTAMGALLHQRGYLPLHANVMEWNGRAYAFAGASGAGKSTLATRLHAQGFGFLSDDICALSWDAAGLPRAWPGIPRVKLWRDAVAQFAMDPEQMRPLSWTTEKFEAPVDYQTGGASLPLAAVYDLREEEDGAPRGVHRLAGVDAVNSLVAHTYRRRITDFLGSSGDYLRRVLELSKATPIFVARRRWGYDEFDQEMRNIQASVDSVDASFESSTR